MDLHHIPDQAGAAFPPQMDLTPVIESMRAHLEMIAAMAGAPVQPITITDEQRHMAAVRREMNRPSPRVRIDIDELTAKAVAAEREALTALRDRIRSIRQGLDFERDTRPDSQQTVEWLNTTLERVRAALDEALVAPEAAHVCRCGHEKGQHSNAREDDYRCNFEGCYDSGQCNGWAPR